MAAIQGREFAIPDDTKAVVQAVLNHRVLLSPDARLRGRTVPTILNEIIDSVDAPVERVEHRDAAARTYG
jgi:MoxR-like ATPase